MLLIHSQANDVVFNDVIISLVFFLLVIGVCQFLFIIFQRQILDFIEKRKKIKIVNKTINEIKYFINSLSSTLAKMSFDKIGALIIIENKDNLNKYIDLGKKVDVNFFPEFVTSVFYNHKSPLHDGAMIIRNLKIVSVSSYLYTTNRVVDVQYGARHRAAFGICEYYDCFAFVVSETNGNITFAHGEEIKHLSQNPEELTNQIINIFSSYSIYKSKFRK